MKGFVLFVVILFTSFSSISAKTSTSVPVRTNTQTEVQQGIQDRKDIFEERREELKNQIQLRKATASARLQEKNQQQVKLYFSYMYRRFDAAIERLNILVSRIENRILELKTNGEDVSLLEADIAEAKTLLDSAKAEMDAIESNLDIVLASDDPRTAFGEVKDAIADVKDTLFEVKKILISVLREIQGLHVGQYKLTPIPTIGV